MQWRIEEGESLFSSVLPPLEKELGLEDNSEGEPPVPNLEAIYMGYGIDVDGSDFYRYLGLFFYWVLYSHC